MVPESEFTTTMAESMATRAWQPASRHGAGGATERSHLNPQAGG